MIARYGLSWNKWMKHCIQCCHSRTNDRNRWHIYLRAIGAYLLPASTLYILLPIDGRNRKKNKFKVNMLKRRRIRAFCWRSRWHGSVNTAGGAQFCHADWGLLWRTTHVGHLSVSTSLRHRHRLTGQAAAAAVVHVVDCWHTVVDGVRARTCDDAVGAGRPVTAVTSPRPRHRLDLRRTSGRVNYAEHASCVAPLPDCVEALSTASPARVRSAARRTVPEMTEATSRRRWVKAASESRQPAESWPHPGYDATWAQSVTVIVEAYWWFPAQYAYTASIKTFSYMYVWEQRQELIPAPAAKSTDTSRTEEFHMILRTTVWSSLPPALRDNSLSRFGNGRKVFGQ